MIIFSKLRYQNLLATGNNFIEFDFLKHSTTLIVGNNGSGKSTMLEALVYSLYGRAFRNINLPQLINSITGKGLLTEIEFSIGETQYMIRRGIKPTILNIFINGKEQKSRGPREDQKFIEENILKMNFKTFIQVVVLGATNYTPFMLLTAGDRRKFVENLLDIQVFTVMNSLLKTRVDFNNEEIRDIETQITLCENKIEIEKKHLQLAQQDNDKLIEAKQKQITNQEVIAEEARLKLLILQRQVSEAASELTDKNKLKDKQSKLIQFKASISEKVRRINDEVAFFENHDDCPTCKQGIQHDFKVEVMQKHSEKTVELQTGLNTLSDEIDLVNENLEKIRLVNENITNLNLKIAGENQTISSTNRFIEEMNKEIKSLQIKTNAIESSDTSIKDLTKDLNQYKNKKKVLLDDKAVYIIGGKLLKDTGIKTKIISQYIPIINKLVNQFLSKMDMFVEFNLDDNFSETIKSRHRDEFTFESFSEGEKLRITLSILFAWRAIAKMRNSASTNLLIMDEVLDSSLDIEGTEEFIEMIKNLTTDTNMFIISHKGESLYDRFDHVIRFEKHSNFSRLVE